MPLAVAAAIEAALLCAAPETGFKVVVNAANPVDGMSRARISRLFLKTETVWSNGLKVRPADLNQSSAVRESFSKAIHGRAVTAIAWYWQKLIFSGAGVPPVELPNDEAILAFVRANPGAVAYVSEAASLPAGVKELQVNE